MSQDRQPLATGKRPNTGRPSAYIRFKSMINRNSRLVILGLTAAVLFLITTQIRSLSASSNSTMVDFKSIKPAEFKPEMIVGKYFVECKSDPKAQILLAQEKQVITRDELPEKTRVIPEGMFVTMDYVEDRFNIHIRNETNEIYKAKFG